MTDKDNLKFLDRSKISPRYQVTLTEFVRKEFDVKPGELVLFYKNQDGEIILKKG